MRKPVLGYESCYEVSDLGTVYRTTTRSGRELQQPKPVIPTKRRKYRAVWLSKAGIRTLKALHRIVWEAHNGPIPSDKVMNHIDGNPSNNTLANLEVVTQRENIKHSVEVLGNLRDCANNPQAKLTLEKVVELRQRRYAGESIAALSRDTKIPETTIRGITTGKTWKAAPGPITPPRAAKGENHPLSKLTSVDIPEIIKLHKKGTPVNTIAKRFGVTYPTIKRIVVGNGWDHIEV